MKSSPSPWKTGGYSIRSEATGDLVAIVYGKTNAEREANARLICDLVNKQGAGK